MEHVLLSTIVQSNHQIAVIEFFLKYLLTKNLISATSSTQNTQNNPLNIKFRITYIAFLFYQMETIEAKILQFLFAHILLYQNEDSIIK
jgi:hypothetical protein